MENQTNKTEEKTFTTIEVGTMLEKIESSIKLLAESMNIKFDGVYERFDKVENRLDAVKTKIDRLQDDMVEVKYELRQKVSVKDLEKLEKRVVKLEKISYSR